MPQKEYQAQTHYRKFRKPPFGNGWFQIGTEGDSYIFVETMHMESMSIGHAAKTHLDCFHDN